MAKETAAKKKTVKEKRRFVMSDSAYRILVVVLLVLILIGVVADVAMQMAGIHGGPGGIMRFGAGGKGDNDSHQRGPQRDQGQGWLPGFELSTA
jgi:hypothetical protein